ncbi:MAG: proton-conducting membrane transporter [Firmicutes bacterium]|nr:proton-conducting membrane transporter [Bacillota bacterium]
MTNAVTLLTISDGLSIQFASDGLGRIFLCLDTVMWILAAIYASKYKEHMKKPKQFFVFFGLTYLMLAALSMAANYLTMYLCFEFMTLLSMPMVLNDGTMESIAAARKYLMYSIFGATLGLLGFFFSAYYGTSAVFVSGGVLDAAKTAGKEGTLLVTAFISIVGFGAKAGLFPLHAWLPTAHPVAPAPASAVLSGVITKAGVLCILRIVYQVYGAAFLSGTWVQTALIVLALITVFMGSMMAYGEDLLKKRLAYSTVSQVSYVLFGVFTMNPAAVLGALLHVVYHSIIKDCLFFGAGAVIFTNHKEYVSQLRGMGKKMPVTYGCFTICSLGLIGIPPFAGFLSKWYLATGSLSEGLPVLSWLGPAVLLLSALLTAGYLLPISIQGFFPGEGEKEAEGKEAPGRMLFSMLVLAAATVLLGIFAQPLSDVMQQIAGGLF